MPTRVEPQMPGVAPATTPRPLTIDDLLLVITHMQQQQQQPQPQPTPPPPPPVPQEPARGSTNVIADFCRLQPPIFTGEGDPMLAAKWLEQMEKSLELLGVTDDATSIKLVSFQLRDSAEAWWRFIKDSRKDVGTT